jgi:uncharacterized protein (TIGR03546 family)
MLTLIAKLLKILNSEADPSQISLGLSFSLITGFIPFFSPIGLFVLLIVFLLRVNLSSFFLGTAFFSGVAYIIDPLFNRVGLFVLTLGSLEHFWTILYNSTIWRIQHFNNSIVMGGLVVALLCFVPLFLLFNVLVRKYRDHVLVWVQKTRIMKFFTATKLYSIYDKIAG